MKTADSMIGWTMPGDWSKHAHASESGSDAGGNCPPDVRRTSHGHPAEVRPYLTVPYQTVPYQTKTPQVVAPSRQTGQRWRIPWPTSPRWVRTTNPRRSKPSGCRLKPRLWMANGSSDAGLSAIGGRRWRAGWQIER